MPAFQHVMAAYKRPKDERAPFVEEALHGAALVPLEVLERAAAMGARLETMEVPARIRLRPGGGQGADHGRENRRDGERAHQPRKHERRRVPASVNARLRAI
jgi:hypothetical protein